MGAESRTPPLAGGGAGSENRKTAGAKHNPRPAAIQVPRSAPDLTRALGGAWSGSYGLANCPAHGDDGRPLRISIGERAPTLKCEGGCLRAAIVAGLKARGLWRELPTAPLRLKRVRRDRQRNINTDAAWRDGPPIEGTAAEYYLAAVGLTPPWPDCLRFALVEHGIEPSPLPALLAPIRDGDGAICGTLATILPRLPTLPAPRFATCPPTGLAVRLGEPGDDLGLAPDLVTALIAQAVTGCPTWAAVEPDLAGAIIVPCHVQRIHIFADRERKSQQVAEAARLALQRGRQRAFVTPPPNGAASFPEALRQRRAA